ncbi:hypothetical protein JY651_17150 [Pyxidicoccus parkwayensis]|uniref:PKD domain-containing protein n=1 Tax=Pyxidicoccus parkwayensis TaxID=2813578 RepID=A0ABX7P808_9BACT|nr:hypothetical protein [Pyxidicoccus parkwaysis]QSQ26550.1 hypothetical protein JY651_17150 [Pyxidicoccus parkwaysis]
MCTRHVVQATLAVLALLTPLLGHAQLVLERVGPTSASTATLHRGERVGFSARATSPAGGIHGSEWYLGGSYLGAQYRTSLPGSTEYDATFWRGINFPTTGTFRVEVQAFDRAGNYSSPAAWTLNVVERPRFLYVDQTDSLLDAPQATQDAFWSFVAARRINQLGIYRLNQVTRLESLSREWGRPVQVWPIFSAECDFSGRWFSDNRFTDALELAETTMLDAYRADDRTFRNGLRVAGFAYFARTHLTAALAGATCGP